MAGYCKQRNVLQERSCSVRAMMLWLSAAVGGLMLLAGCGSGQPETSSAPPSQQPVQTAPQPQRELAPKAKLAANVPVPEAPFDLSYLDVETELFVFARPAAIVSSPIVQQLTGGKLGPIDEMQDRIGISIEQIDTVTVGIRHLKHLTKNKSGQFLMTQPGIPGSMMLQPFLPADAVGQVVVVIRTSDPVNVDELNQSLSEGDGSQILTHESKNYYSLFATRDVNTCLYLADETTLIMAAEPSIKEIIEQGEQVSQPQVDLSFIPEVADLIVAVLPETRQPLFAESRKPAPRQPSQRTAAAPQGFSGRQFNGNRGRDEDQSPLGASPSPSPLQISPGQFLTLSLDPEEGEDPSRSIASPITSPLADLQRHLIDHFDAVAVLVDLKADVKLHVLVRCDHARSAAKAGALAGRAVRSARQSFDQSRESWPGVIQQVSQALLETVESGVQDQTLTLSITIPESQNANLTVLPIAVMGMMTGGAMSMDVIGAMVDQESLARQFSNRGQPPVSPDGLPSGLELSALARWSVSSPAETRSSVPLEFAIVASGELAARTTAFGRLKLTEMKVDEGTRLIWLGAAHAEAGENPMHDFVTIDRTDMFSRHPRTGVSVDFGFSFTGHPPSNLQVVAGEFTLRAATSVRVVTFTQLPAPGRWMQDAVLQAANFTVTTVTRPGSEAIIFDYDSSPSIGIIKVLGADGNPLPFDNWSKTSFGDHVRQTVFLPETADLQQLGLRVGVFEDVQEIPVAFRFESLPLPAPQTLSPNEQVLLSWTPSDLVDELPDGLIADAHVRWPAPRLGSVERSPGATNGNPLAAANRLPVTNPGSAGLLQQGPTGGGQVDDGSMSDDELAELLASGFGGGSAGFDDVPANPPGRQTPANPLGRGGQSNQQGGPSANSLNGISAFGDMLGAGNDPSLKSTANRDEPLQVAIDLTGPLTETVIAAGELTIDSVMSRSGEELSYEGCRLGGEELADGWVNIGSETVIAEDQPPEGLRILFLFAPPELPVHRIAQFRGTLKLRTAREQTDVIVRNLNDRTDRRIKDRLLGRYGIEFAVLIEDGVLKYRMLKGDGDRIAEMFPVDSTGERITNASHWTVSDNGNLIHLFEFPRNVPSRVGLKFIVNLGLQEVEVPLRFSNLPVPPRPDDVDNS